MHHSEGVTMNYMYYLDQRYEYSTLPYNYQNTFPAMRPVSMPPIQALPTPPLHECPSLDKELTFSPDGMTVFTESQQAPLIYYIHQLRTSHSHHMWNKWTATCYFFSRQVNTFWPAHRPYLAAQSLYFRTIFERHQLNGQFWELEVPHQEVFSGVYEYLYTGDVDEWLRKWFTTTEQVRSSWELVKFLELVDLPEKVSRRARMELEAVRLTRK
ncbi:hypothetical protein BC938DRAFT_473320 [Jimgerdemannia flammicorona]|uniref:BTB domain-containing protein n=1 Tax=Jimgerdemannia flammicorona TaxID=994334 RepID=A0A433QTE1_9FUNG|nr:hypothetical protein BC938DRAFT_473320 [Jimgerdemannia flammicorona]